MSIQVLFDAAYSAIKQHNEVVGEGSPGFVDPDAFIDALKVSGYTSVEVLSKLSFEKFAACLPAVDVHGEKKPMSGLAESIGKAIRLVAKVDIEAKTEDGRKYVGPKKVRQLSLRQLVESYDPAESNNEVGKRLAEISKGQPFVVFKSGRSVHIDATLILLEELKQGYPPRQFYEIEGIPQEVQSLGYIPDNYAEENPLYVGRPLRPDGTCDQTNRSWAGVDIQVKQFLRVGSDMGIIKVNRLEDAHYFMDLALNTPDSLKVLRQRYAAVSVQFDKLAKEGKLPTLKISLALPKVEKKGAKTSPFDGGKPVQWIAPASPVCNYYRPVKPDYHAYGHGPDDIWSK